MFWEIVFLMYIYLLNNTSRSKNNIFSCKFKIKPRFMNSIEIQIIKTCIQIQIKIKIVMSLSYQRFYCSRGFTHISLIFVKDKFNFFVTQKFCKIYWKSTELHIIQIKIIFQISFLDNENLSKRIVIHKF